MREGAGPGALTRLEERSQAEAYDPSAEGRAKEGRRCERSGKVRIVASSGERREQVEAFDKKETTGVHIRRAGEEVDELGPYVADGRRPRDRHQGEQAEDLASHGWVGDNNFRFPNVVGFDGASTVDVICTGTVPYSTRRTVHLILTHNWE